MVLPGARGPRQGCGAGAAEHPTGRAWGWLCTSSEGATVLGHICSQLCLQHFPMELPRMSVSPAGDRKCMAKDTCLECG